MLSLLIGCFVQLVMCKQSFVDLSFAHVHIYKMHVHSCRKSCCIMFSIVFYIIIVISFVEALM